MFTLEHTCPVVEERIHFLFYLLTEKSAKNLNIGYIANQKNPVSPSHISGGFST
jgi:hypothetical protein